MSRTFDRLTFECRPFTIKVGYDGGGADDATRVDVEEAVEAAARELSIGLIRTSWRISHGDGSVVVAYAAPTFCREAGVMHAPPDGPGGPVVTIVRSGDRWRLDSCDLPRCDECVYAARVLGVHWVMPEIARSRDALIAGVRDAMRWRGIRV